MDDNPNVKGNVAEAAIAFDAVKIGIPVFKPVAEHGRADLVFEVAGQFKSVQCKWGRLVGDRRVIAIQLAGPG